MNKDYCENCDGLVPVDELESVCAFKGSQVDPPEYQEICASCRGVTGDEPYDRAVDEEYEAQYAADQYEKNQATYHEQK